MKSQNLERLFDKLIKEQKSAEQLKKETSYIPLRQDEIDDLIAYLKTKKECCKKDTVDGVAYQNKVNMDNIISKYDNSNEGLSQNTIDEYLNNANRRRDSVDVTIKNVKENFQNNYPMWHQSEIDALVGAANSFIEEEIEFNNLYEKQKNREDKKKESGESFLTQKDLDNAINDANLFSESKRDITEKMNALAQYRKSKITGCDVLSNNEIDALMKAINEDDKDNNMSVNQKLKALEKELSKEYTICKSDELEMTHKITIAPNTHNSYIGENSNNYISLFIEGLCREDDYYYIGITMDEAEQLGKSLLEIVNNVKEYELLNQK